MENSSQNKKFEKLLDMAFVLCEEAALVMADYARQKKVFDMSILNRMIGNIIDPIEELNRLRDNW